MKKFLTNLLLIVLFSGLSFGTEVNIYDKYGRKTGSYKTSGSTITKYNKYGQKESFYNTNRNITDVYDSYGLKTGSYKTNGNTTTKYNKYGQKVGSFQKIQMVQRPVMINTAEKQGHINKIPQVELHNMTNMAGK